LKLGSKVPTVKKFGNGGGGTVKGGEERFWGEGRKLPIPFQYKGGVAGRDQGETKHVKERSASIDNERGWFQTR